MYTLYIYITYFNLGTTHWKKSEFTSCPPGIQPAHWAPDSEISGHFTGKPLCATRH